MIGRRSFLRRLGAAAVALTLARHLPGIAPKPQELPVPEAEIAYTKTFAQLDPSTERYINRFDVIYGWSAISDFAVLVQG